MKNPRPVNFTTTEEVRSKGWIAEARDADGHLISIQGWHDICSTNENLKALGEFIAEYETDMTVSVFHDLLAAKLAA